MSTKPIIDAVNDKCGFNAAYAVSIAIVAAQQMVCNYPDEFKRQYGEEGIRLLRGLSSGEDK